jgi:hypothetical protein
MYYGKVTNRDWQGPHRKFPYPPNWSNELEDLWQEYLANYFQSIEKWETFWKPVDCECIEQTISYWKEYMESVLPLYICRETNVLKECGLVTETIKTNIVTDEKEVSYETEDEDNMYY